MSTYVAVMCVWMVVRTHRCCCTSIQLNSILMFDFCALEIAIYVYIALYPGEAYNKQPLWKFNKCRKAYAMHERLAWTILELICGWIVHVVHVLRRCCITDMYVCVCEREKEIVTWEAKYTKTNCFQHKSMAHSTNNTKLFSCCCIYS